MRFAPPTFLVATAAAALGGLTATTGLLPGPVVALAEEPPTDCLAVDEACSEPGDCCSGVCHGDGYCAAAAAAAAAAASSSSCDGSDDPTWSVTLDCAWVAEDPTERCSIVGILDAGGRPASDACVEACGTPCPTSDPTADPTDGPTESPTMVPTAGPTASPTESPTASPTESPTPSPTAGPTSSPTASPTLSPTPAPVTPAPVTPAPVPTTPAPVPTTPAPVTPAPTTPAPVTPAPVTAAPVTPAPVAPVTPAPVTKAPTGTPPTPAPATSAPVTSAPIAGPPPTTTTTSAPASPDAFRAMSCPDPGSSTDLGLADGGTLEVGLSSAGTLCTLTEVQSDPTDPTIDVQLIPLGRSYDGRPWEAVAGSYSEGVFPTGPPHCTSSKCTIPLPPPTSSDSRYVLRSYDRTLAPRDEVSRFLDQVTFGVRTSELDAEEAALDSSVDSNHWRASYVRDQIDPAVTPMTSHREWFRVRTNPKTTHSIGAGRSDTPCSPNSRWRRYAFSRHDYRNSTDGTLRKIHFYEPAEDAGLPDPVIYEAEDVILSAPSGLVPLVDTLNGQTDGFYGLCEGDCDADSDCAEGLVCYQRNKLEPVMGCYGHGSAGSDYCVDVEALTVGGTLLAFTGNPLDPNPGGACQGDCDSDSQCAGELRCWQRSGGEPVPGCSGHDLVDPTDDFCYDPKTSWTQPPYSGYTIDSTPNSGFTGTSYLEHYTDSTFGQDKSWAEWTIEVETAGTYPLSLRYAQSKEEIEYGPMYIELTVNEGSGGEQVHQVPTPFSLGSDDWLYTKYVDAVLQAGSNKVKIRNMQKYGANIDHLRVGKARATIIEVDGHYRTVVHDRVRYSEGVDANSEGQSIEYSDASTKHPYEFCRYPMLYNVVKKEGDLQVRPKGASGCGTSNYIDTLNPLVDFAGYENYVPGVLFYLPDLADSSAWAGVADEEDYYKLAPGNDFILKEGIQDDLCAEVPASAEEGDAPILAKLPDGTYLQWTGVLNLEENTVDSPYSDGGGAIAKSTEHVKDHANCFNAPRSFLNEGGCVLSDSSEACAASNRESSSGGATLVCGSIGEVSNDHTLGQLFSLHHGAEETESGSVLDQQKTKVWTHIALEGRDQLRQKMAWGLSEIYTVVKENIPSEDLSEVYLNYYDIFVRNAFGNLRDILKEISYSPLMAYHLTYRGSKSSAYIYADEDGRIIMPDENYAREIMQLFTIGLEMMNDDGTLQRDEHGHSVPTYTNEEIMSFARAWTGFQAHKLRGNFEQVYESWRRNLLDPLYIEESWRDRFPKHDLTGGYIGDTYPLCVDMPDKAFLHKGAKYRLLGSNPLPELMKDHPDLQFGDQHPSIKRMVLSSSSDLFAALNNGGAYEAVVELSQNLDCTDNECNVDTVRVVQVAANPDIFYEYVSLPCVQQAFFEGPKQIARYKRHYEGAMCADPRLPAASEACGNQDIGATVRNALQYPEYTRERVTYATAEARCTSRSSTLPVIPLDQVGNDLGIILGHCQGDCDVDDDCQGNLVCFDRHEGEPVPGCTSSVEPLPVIKLDDSVGNNQGTDAYGFCQGDCDRDSDCQGDLVCFQRSGYTEVPGCDQLADTDPLDPIPLDESVGNNKGTDAYGHCQGDCDSDTDCRGDLKCFQRSGVEDVPGCNMTAGAGSSGKDFCYLPEYVGKEGSDYCIQPEQLGTKDYDFCVDPMFESGMFKFGKVAGEGFELGYHWTSFDCSIQAKINNEGYVALVHETDNVNTIPSHLNAEQSLNYFKVFWGGDGTYPSPATGCGGCKLSHDACICPTKVVNEIAFAEEPASVEEIVSSLYIGAVPPDIVGPPGTFISQTLANKGFTVHFPQESSGVYTAETVFEFNHPYHGNKLFLKNTKSTVHLEGWSALPTILEAEEAVSGSTSDPKPTLVLSNETTRDSFTGVGYMAFQGVDEGYLSWTINVPETVVATLSFRYENSWGPSLMVDILVNDNAVHPEKTKLGSTGDWDYWFYTDAMQVSLTAGENVIQIQYSGLSDGPNIDHLKIDWPAAPSSYSFRNPVHFMSLSQDHGDNGEGETTARDAAYETDAVLDHYFQHRNTAPFMCIRLIQRFFNSNPSPGHIKSCASAFRTGTYTSGGQTFGSGVYGSLEAVVASITLAPEATSAVLDADPGHGRIREPFLQPIQMLRSLEADLMPQENHFDLWELFDRLGQEPHHFETVFSHFLPEYVPDIGPNIEIGYVAPEAMQINMPSIIAQLNGLMGLVRYGISDCFDDGDLGFGRYPGFGKCLDNGSMQRASALLSYSPKATTSAELIGELNTLLCAGRLSQARQDEIVAACDAYSPSYDEVGAKLRFAYQLIISTPEFHTNTIVKEDPTTARPGPLSSSSGTSTTNDYKATILMFLDGGCDSFNMLPPLDCQDDLYEKYVDIRGGLSNTTENPGVALPKEGLWEIPTDNTEHVCTSLGLHQKLSFLKELYDQDDAIFVTNSGLMQFPVTKENYRDINAQLFSHNGMQRETKREDLEDEEVGTGVLGRMRDTLTKAGFSTHSYSIVGSQVSLCGKPGVTDGAITLPSSGMKKFIPEYTSSSYPEGDLTPDLTPYILSLNNASALDSSFLAETYSAKVTNAIYQHQELYDALEGATVTANFEGPDGRKSSICRQLEMTAKVMAIRGLRGAERDLFHVGVGGWDMHSNVIDLLESKFEDLNFCLSAFVEELKNIGLWDDTVLLQFSEFGRTLNPNSGPDGDGTGKGVDHAYGGNQFLIGGGLKGGQVLGQYPQDFTENGPLALSRGRILPTTPWDALWSGVAPWMGVPAEDMDYVLPMRDNFESSVLFSEETLFNP